MNKISAVVIFSSPHRSGSCSKLLDCFLEKIEHPLNITSFNAYELSAHPCTDCGFCKTTQKCAFRDLDELYYAIENCELLIIVSSIYNMSFPSPMKAILDRFQMYYNARFSLGIRPPVEKHRKAVLLACGGSPYENGEFMINQLRQSFSVMNTDLCACAVINGLDKSPLDTNDSRITDCSTIINKVIDTLSV